MLTETELPQVNLNGTMGKVLLENCVQAAQSLLDTIAVFKQTEPHGRDYPTPGKYLAAREEYIARLRDLERVSTYLEALIVHLDKFS